MCVSIGSEKGAMNYVNGYLRNWQCNVGVADDYYERAARRTLAQIQNGYGYLKGYTIDAKTMTLVAPQPVVVKPIVKAKVKKTTGKPGMKSLEKALDESKRVPHRLPDFHDRHETKRKAKTKVKA